MRKNRIWININLAYDRIKDLELKRESIVIIKIGFPKKEDSQYVDTTDNRVTVLIIQDLKIIPVATQESNFYNQLKVISDYKEMEKIIIGDINVDFRILSKTESEKDNYEKSFSKIVKAIQNYLLAKGFSQIISDNTRKGKILDHTNTQNKVHRFYTELDSSTDHKFITLENK